MNNINIKINGQALSVNSGLSVLEACRAAGFDIPTLCHIKGLHEEASCRVCLVEDGYGRLISSCSTPAYDGMEIITNSGRVLEARRTNLELMCENHRMDCGCCVRYTHCEFHELCSHTGINCDNYELFTLPPRQDISECITRDNSKCVLCRRCVSACSEQGLSLVSPLFRGPLTEIGTALPLAGFACIGCGQCAAACPTAALYPTAHSEKLWKLLLKKERRLVALVSSAAAAMLGEAYHDAPGTSDPAKVPAVLRKLGFDEVYPAELFEDRSSAALAEEAAERELVISASCPGIISYIDRHASHLKRFVSDTEPPLAALISALREEAPPGDFVFIGSCTALKAYACRLGLSAVLTVPELSSMLDRACVSRASALRVWRTSEKGQYDTLPSAALPHMRSDIDIQLMHRIDSLGEFIEKAADFRKIRGIITAKACPGGCINGGGQYRLYSRELSDGKQYLRGQNEGT